MYFWYFDYFEQTGSAPNLEMMKIKNKTEIFHFNLIFLNK